jgi:hypothetical protein
VTTPSDAPPPSGPGDGEPKALPLQLELPQEKPQNIYAQAGEPAGAERAGRKRAKARTSPLRWAVRVGIALAVLGGAAAVVVLWVLPWYVRRECIETAAEHGIALEVDGAAIDASGFRLIGVRATAADVPGARAEAPEVEVVTSGLHPDKMTVKRAQLALEGRLAAVDAALAKWRASPSGGQGGAWMPSTLVVDESRVVWQAPIEGARLEAANVHFDVTWHPASSGTGTTSDVHARSDKVTLVVPGGTLGPWRVDVDRTPGTSRMRVALDPGVPDACTLLVVGNDERTTSVDVVVPRSPLARLGVPAEMLGLRGSALQVEANAHYVALGPQRADATGKGGLYGIDAGLPRPLDVAWEATATGDPRVGLDVKKARLAAGPLVGALTGMLKTFDDGFRLDLAWSADKVPCTAFEAPLAEDQPFDIAYQLRKLAEATGITKIKGDVSARGSLAFDTRDLSTAKAEFTPDVTCQVAMFAH